jgi:hypothetical protein
MADVIQFEIKRKPQLPKAFVEGTTAQILLFNGVRFERFETPEDMRLQDSEVRNRAV